MIAVKCVLAFNVVDYQMKWPYNGVSAPAVAPFSNMD